MKIIRKVGNWWMSLSLGEAAIISFGSAVAAMVAIAAIVAS
ncbi:MAG TPA: hypothetical protein VHD31_00700 [Candidatus Paceibacterota bacterium]|nr:hypothetical protein [Candidatus Paceibacterota bacterium]